MSVCACLDVFSCCTLLTGGVRVGAVSGSKESSTERRVRGLRQAEEEEEEEESEERRIDAAASFCK